MLGEHADGGCRTFGDVSRTATVLMLVLALVAIGIVGASGSTFVDAPRVAAVSSGEPSETTTNDPAEAVARHATSRDAGARRRDAGAPVASVVTTTLAPPTTTTPMLDPSVDEAIAAISTMQARLDANRAALLAGGATPDTAQSITSAMRAQEGAMRLQQLASDDPTWMARIDEYDAQREPLGPDASPEEVEALRRRMFTTDEQERLHAWEALHALLESSP